MTVKFGENIQVELYGTSHGPCVGVHIDGLPAGRKIDTQKLQLFLDRRAPGKNAWSTPRKEADRPVFLSGVRALSEAPSSGEDVPEAVSDMPETVSDMPEAESDVPEAPSFGADVPEAESDLPGFFVTTGERLTAEIRNTNTRPQDYRNPAVVPRPAHADYPAWVKYGRIESGGGQFSARLTAALCIAGGIFLQWLEDAGVSISTHIRSIGFIEDVPFDPVAGNVFVVDDDFPVIDQRQGEAMKELIAKVKESGDSIGGSIECMICGLPAGIGEPLFGSIESRICQTVFAVPAVKGIEFGAGFGVTSMKGSENNDPFELVDEAGTTDEAGVTDETNTAYEAGVTDEMGTADEAGLTDETNIAYEAGVTDECNNKGEAADRVSLDDNNGSLRIRTVTNNHGGILGGLSSGMPVLFRTAMKPTPSIAMEQQSVDLSAMTPATLQIKGRHDPCIVPRAVPCIEAAAAVAIMDLLLGDSEG